jgi:hypothetical protein
VRPVNRVGLVLLLACGCGDPAPGSPFAVSATPRRRATLLDACADPAVAWHERHEDHDSILSQGECRLLMRFDAVDLRIRYLSFSTGNHYFGYPGVRRFLNRHLLPMLTPEVRDYVWRHVLADVEAKKELRRAVRGKGAVTYRNDPYVLPDGTQDPGVELTIEIY